MAILVCAAALASSAGAANSQKPYSIVICGNGQTGCTSASPAVVGPGGTAAFPSYFTVTITNHNKLGAGIQVGSDNLNVPTSVAGFTVSNPAAQAPPPAPQPLPTCPATLSPSDPACIYLYDSSGNVVQSGGTTVGFRNLSLAPGSSIEVLLAATTPSLSTPGCTTAVPCLFSDQAKQSNDFGGTGNNLNSTGSAYGMVTNSTAACAKRKGCSTQLGDGGNNTGGPGSINVLITTSSGKTAVTQTQALDFGPPPDPSLCMGQFGPVSSAHYTYWNMFNGADNGADRSQTVSITTTPGFPGYVQQLCFVSETRFTMKSWNGSAYVSGPANSTSFSDGGQAYEGLLPDCTTNPAATAPTVDCSKLPGVLERVTNADGTTTTIGAIPPGFDRAVLGN